MTSKDSNDRLAEKSPITLEGGIDFQNFLQLDPLPSMSLNELRFESSNISFPSSRPNLEVISNYHKKRDFPGINSTTRLGVHFRFGTVSIRALTELAIKSSEVWLNELIWRDFYSAVLQHFPYVVDQEFNKKYRVIPWKNDENDFSKWCEGKTGYPIVDAGMRELNQTGFMHNRVRMIVASFLTKHLLIDWRWGEAYFAAKLLDFELASNNGGWQWAAGTGTDAQPYFRVFNPASQMEKFDKNHSYVKRWIPELGTAAYPNPVVDHKMARNRAIEVFKKAAMVSS